MIEEALRPECARCNAEKKNLPLSARGNEAIHRRDRRERRGKIEILNSKPESRKVGDSIFGFGI
jgi:hypothetical protein